MGKVEAHMSAPLLQEREAFLAKKQAEGNGLRSLQMTADQLLFTTIHLPLTNATTMVGLTDIVAMQHEFDGPKSSFLVSTVVQWLEDLGLLDPMLNDQSILFNPFSSVPLQDALLGILFLRGETCKSKASRIIIERIDSLPFRAKRRNLSKKMRIDHRIYFYPRVFLSIKGPKTVNPHQKKKNLTRGRSICEGL